MMQNQAIWERAIRIVAGAGLIAGGYLYSGVPGPMSWIIMVIGAVLVATGAIAYCPAWHMFGISTRKTKQEVPAGQ